ncbi:Hypothetical protein NGAL_HAMBI2566_48030 [Neorhizobium galegae bv. orientalis]|nr:Hypothetical protein NGAL_HAMBI2566_48030 [Neorhizobium galegae bv. orientalis]
MAYSRLLIVSSNFIPGLVWGAFTLGYPAEAENTPE